MNVLILFAHPALEKSRINKVLIRGLKKFKNVTFHDLYEAYPNFYIDVEAEQKLLEKHDVIIFHHPFYWYSIPAILKEWLELVLKHGWAYGSNGEALKGKYAIHAITTGGSEASYSNEGNNGRSMREFLYPVEQPYKLCKMNYLPPFVVHGTHLMERENAEKHKEDYHKFLKALTEDKFNFKKAGSQTRLNANLDSLIINGGN